VTISEYWAGVRESAVGLPEETWLISLDNREKGSTSGRVVQATRDTAAKLIFERTHRVATENEIRAYLSEQEKVREGILEAEYQRKQHFALPKELAGLVEAVVRQSQTERKK